MKRSRKKQLKKIKRIFKEDQLRELLFDCTNEGVRYLEARGEKNVDSRMGLMWALRAGLARSKALIAYDTLQRKRGRRT